MDRNLLSRVGGLALLVWEGFLIFLECLVGLLIVVFMLGVPYAVVVVMAGISAIFFLLVGDGIYTGELWKIPVGLLAGAFSGYITCGLAIAHTKGVIAEIRS